MARLLPFFWGDSLAAVEIPLLIDGIKADMNSVSVQPAMSIGGLADPGVPMRVSSRERAVRTSARVVPALWTRSAIGGADIR